MVGDTHDASLASSDKKVCRGGKVTPQNEATQTNPPLLGESKKKLSLIVSPCDLGDPGMGIPGPGSIRWDVFVLPTIFQVSRDCERLGAGPKPIS